MASGIDLGPVPEFEGHHLESLHARSRSLGQVGTCVLCVGLFFGAGALGQAAFSARPLSERTRTVTVSLNEEVPSLASKGEAAAFSEQVEPIAQPEASGVAPAPNPEPQSTPSSAPPLAAEILPLVSPESLGHVRGTAASHGGGGRGLGLAGSGQGTGSAFQGRGQGSGIAGEGIHRGVDQGAIYRSSLASWLAARKRYPAAARNQGRQGEVLLALEIDPQGVLTLIRLERSSGHDLLDQAALSLVRSCGALPPPPPGLRQIRVSVDYSLA